ncbi:MAG: SDR family NAD(P)-dependent oxidoreductase [Parvibaculaceae bacterium]
MDLQLKGKTVFIAGASRGIGLGMARAFAKEGAKVALTGRGEASLDEARDLLIKEGANKADLLTIAGDMTSSEVIAQALDATEKNLGPVHCAIANVGLGRAPLGLDVSDADWEADIKQNLLGGVYLAREALKRILARPAAQREGANIILISSIAGVDALGTPLTYSATKSAINHTAKSLAKIVGKDNVRVNAIAPGNIIFEGGDWQSRVDERPDAWGRWINREVALRRFGKVEEIADAALFLASARASFITGEILVVDGGQVK